MSEPLVLQFQADTSRAQSAMASLAASVVGNMASIGVAMSGGAANSNSFGAALSGLQTNALKAATAIGADVRKIATDTAAAATKEGATLEGVVRSFTAAAAGSSVAGAAVRSGVTGTSTAITTLVSQIPSLTTLLGAFLAFEAVKLVFNTVSASIEEARQHVEEFVKIRAQADKSGVGVDFFQRATLNAEKYGLTVDVVTQALERARAASQLNIGEGEHGSNTSAFASRLDQNVRAGNLTSADRATFTGADTQEAKIRAVLDLIDKLRSQSRDLAAFDLAGKFFGPDFERQLRNGVDLTTKLREAVNATSLEAGGKRIISDEETKRAEELKLKLQEINSIFAEALAPIQKDLSDSALDIYKNFLEFELSVARAAKFASDLYVQINNVASEIAKAIPSAAELATTLGAVDIGKALGINGVGGKVKEVLDNFQRAVGLKNALDAPEVQGPPAPLSVRIRPKGPDQSNVLPSLHPKAAGGSEGLDAVETLIAQIEKARDTQKAELENVGKTNVERERAVALAKAESVAREDFKKGNRTDAALDDDERSRVLAAAEAWQTYKDRVADAEQKLRQTAEAARYFGQAAADSIADAVLEGKSFADILSSLEKQLARAALNAAFTGQGPLAGLLGLAPAASSGSNAVGGLGGLLSGLFRANGGDVEPGRAYTVGEAGREIFVPGASGRMYPVGSSGGGSGGAAAGPVNVYNSAGDQVQAGARRTSGGGVDVYVARIDSALAGRISSGRGDLSGLIPGSRRLRGV